MPHAVILPGDLSFRPRMFADRQAAGHLLAQALIHYAGTNAIVLGLPRGGVPVADEVARTLGATLDVWVSRKLGAPMQAELGMGAIAEGPAVVLDRSTVRLLGVNSAQLFAVAQREMAEVRRRVERFRGGRPVPELRDRVVILVDDGIATGGTMRAAIRAVKRRRPARLVVAVPVAAQDVVAALRGEVDEVVCLSAPENLYAIGLWYEDFRQVHDDDVVRILDKFKSST
ncbi:MAG TPA: phosphoribosyltransferase family protein [Kofleriaceae bacterium]|nr:phosphoribosyltransferase family protein [Kofleriaceae bacterium]